MLPTLIDVGFGLIFVIALIVGIAEGFSKQFSKPLCKLIAFAGGIGIVALVVPLLSTLPFFTGWVEAASGWFKADFYTTEITSVEDLTAALNSGYLRILAGSADKMFEAMSAALGTDTTMTLGLYFGRLIIYALTDFVAWLILYLAIKYMLYGIKYLMQKIAKVPVFKSIDKILGAVWAIAVCYIIIIGVVLTIGEIVLTTVPSLAAIEESFAQWIEGSTLLQFFHNTNIIGSFLAQLFGLRLIGMAAAA